MYRRLFRRLVNVFWVAVLRLMDLLPVTVLLALAAVPLILLRSSSLLGNPRFLAGFLSLFLLALLAGCCLNARKNVFQPESPRKVRRPPRGSRGIAGAKRCSWASSYWL